MCVVLYQRHLPHLQTVLSLFHWFLQDNTITYHLQLPRQYKISSSFHVSVKTGHLQSSSSSSSSSLNQQCTNTVVRRRGTLHQAILDSKYLRGRIHYLVDWEGYGHQDWSWALDPEMIQTSHHNHNIDWVVKSNLTVRRQIRLDFSCQLWSYKIHNLYSVIMY